MNISLLRELLETRHVVYRELQQICQFDPQSTAMLCEFFYWAGTPTAEKRDGWFYKTANELKRDIGLTRRGYEKARKFLMNLGILDYKRAGVFAKMHYKINTNKLTQLICQIKGIPMPDPNITQVIDRDGFRLPSWIDLHLWHEFLNTRSAKGKKLSHQSKRQHLEELKKIKNLDQDVKQRMTATIKNGWRSFYPLDGKQATSGPQESLEDILKQVHAEREKLASESTTGSTNGPRQARDILLSKFK